MTFQESAKPFVLPAKAEKPFARLQALNAALAALDVACLEGFIPVGDAQDKLDALRDQQYERLAGLLDDATFERATGMTKRVLGYATMGPQPKTAISGNIYRNHSDAQLQIQIEQFRVAVAGVTAQWERDHYDAAIRDMQAVLDFRG